ncbi:nucleotidyltransferase family protein [Luteimonas sp. MC1782]|uniref:nucleotidyltransferase family protein n=1 Tax=Luteimonas sp. MC1782 TaxID=2760305 RepID=UPI001601C8A7|nr:nucleotidyltransferase family protein [Luteimonas sp. MC1782]MBB1471657.1 nucleotidyltransferase family protein [Luteimonas sp. MC1782]
MGAFERWREGRRGGLLRYDARMASLLDQIREALVAFTRLQTPPALIGGLALAAHNVVRATRDVDFLVDADDADRLHGFLLELGYQCVHRSVDAANYLRGEDGLDLLYAHRPIARQLLAAAGERDTPMGRLRVISAEGLVAFKLQGYVNDPTRARDLDDIRALLRAHHETLDHEALREYFRLFEREELLEALIDEVRG